MYICVCHAVTDAEVAASIEAGATSIEAVGDYTRAGTSCGTCHDHIDEVIVSCAAACALADACVRVPERALAS